MIINGNLDVTGDVAAGILKPGVYNIGCSLNAGVFKLTQANGNDFGINNDERGYVVIPSIIQGRYVKLDVTSASHAFEDATASSDLIGENFGTSSGIAWGSVRPFMIYAVNADDTSANLKFAISPKPNFYNSPTGSSIAYHHAPMSAHSDNGMFFLTATNVTATHAIKPSIRIGCFRMSKNSSDNWTIATLATSDGINNFGCFELVDQGYGFPLNQMGAEADTHGFSNGLGTAPVFLTENYRYIIDINGRCRVFIAFDGDGGIDGTGASEYFVTLPYAEVSGLSAPYGICRINNTVLGDSTALAYVVLNTAGFQLRSLTAPTASYPCSNFGNGARSLITSFEFKAF